MHIFFEFRPEVTQTYLIGVLKPTRHVGKVLDMEYLFSQTLFYYLLSASVKRLLCYYHLSASIEISGDLVITSISSEVFPRPFRFQVSCQLGNETPLRDVFLSRIWDSMRIC